MFEKIKKNITIPNIVTYIRGIGGITLLPILFFNGNLLGTIISFAALGATDVIDGFLARVLNAKTPHGEKADPVADKVLGASALTLVTISNLIFGIPLLFELSIAAVGYVKYKILNDKAKPSKLGKVKQVSLIITILFSLISLLIPSFLPVALVLLSITTPLQIATLIGYIKEIKSELVDKEIVKVSEKETEKENIEEKSESQNPTLKKYKGLKYYIERIVESKEEFEMNLGKSFGRKLDRK